MDLDLKTIKNVHFIGIGGIGISAIARMMMQEGKEVTGQDLTNSEIVKELVNEGAEVKIGQALENIPRNTDLIIYTIAIENYAPDLYEKLKSQKDIPIRSYPEMLGIVTKDKYTIAISGTHGKTTTTGMIAQILRDEGKDPTVIIGSLLVGDKSNFISGKSNLFVVEACEYKRSFLNVNPNILVITNIDADHLDYYKDIEDIKSAFRELAMKVPADGFVVCNPDGENVADVVKGISAKVLNYTDFLNPVTKLRIPGVHNKENAAAAFTVASVLATSGRLVDHLEQRNVSLHDVSVLVLDEADRMLDMGFAPQIKKILQSVPKERQTLLFSATLPHEIMKIATGFMKLPLRIEVATQGTTADRVEQEIFVIPNDRKMRLLDKLLTDCKGTVLVFARTKHGVKKVCMNAMHENKL
jgi:UDP-N-acetylmuramoylalanine-D-glutamate ligase